jgi:hypothetical protein
MFFMGTSPNALIKNRLHGGVEVPQEGLEPSTKALGVLYSVHLSYWGNIKPIIAF